MTVKSSANIVILILFAFSDNLSAENSKLSADSWNRWHHLLGCMDIPQGNMMFKLKLSLFWFGFCHLQHGTSQNNHPACCRPQKECNNVCLYSLHCLTNASSNFLLGEMQIGIGCICLSFHRCEFSNVSSKHLSHNRHNGIGCIDLTFLHCVSSKVISNFLNEQRKTLLCVFKWFLKLPAPKDA